MNVTGTSHKIVAVELRKLDISFLQSGEDLMTKQKVASFHIDARLAYILEGGQTCGEFSVTTPLMANDTLEVLKSLIHHIQRDGAAVVFRGGANEDITNAL